MIYRWTIAAQPDENTVNQLAQSINVTPTIAKILVGRGVETFEQAKNFFRPSLSDLLDPFLMKDMDLAVQRSIRAVESGEKIAIYGDYDVDGTSSAAMLYLYFRSLGASVDFYIPDRFTEGYGVSTVGIDRLAETGVSLIITIDCGITAVDQVDYAASRNVDVIICDHHQPADTIPSAFAVLDPIRPGCDYPFKHLSGCGVGFKLIQGIATVRGEIETIYTYLDFVAIAAAADIVPLVGENRLLVSHGLRKLNDAPRPGIRGLFECANIKRNGSITTAQVVFGIAPRINAAGRLGDAKRAVNMMIEEDEVRAFQRAQELETDNWNRRSLDEDIFNQAQKIGEQMVAEGNRRSLVIHNGVWHSGVIGIVASRMVEKFYLPTVMLTTVDGIAKGSARSISGFDIHAALKHCEKYLDQFGGHKYAAGLSIREENIPPFRDALNEFALRNIPDEMLIPELKIDSEVMVDEITPRLFAVIKQFAPFGPGNSRPLFVLRNAEINGYPRIVGKAHLKFRVRCASGTFEAIAFGLGERINELNGRDRFDLVINLEENEFRGTVTQQLRVMDFRVSAPRNGTVAN